MAWPWGNGPRRSDLAVRMGASLSSGIGRDAQTTRVGQLEFAYLPLRKMPRITSSWGPALLPSGKIAVFHGYFDNAPAIASELNAEPHQLARLYGRAVEEWGEEADLRIIGEYCAIICDPDDHYVRLSRSPLKAPPLHYFVDGQLVASASVPRALFAAGVERSLNQRRVADSAVFNFDNVEESWFEGISRVPLGSIVGLRRQTDRELTRYYDPTNVPKVRLKSDAAYIARAGELLDEGVRACLSGFSRPGATLSSGLDSPQVAVRALAALPRGQSLPTFTFHPEKKYDGRVNPGMIGDERPMVEAFTAMHPGLEPHFTANEGYEHDYRWKELFHLMGAAPAGLCNMYVWHGLAEGAAKQGCDLLLTADWGNYTFSDQGRRGFVEYFLKGRWRQLWLALTHSRSSGSRLAKFLKSSVLPLFPDSVWRLAWRIARPNEKFLMPLIQPLSRQYRETSGANERLRAVGHEPHRYQATGRRHALKLLFRNDDVETSEVDQGFEQLYGVAHRDPMAYRPFVEFCFGLPVEMFLRDGTMRWLAKEMAKGIMPEEQRANALHGRWDADWHLRIGRRRKDYLAELDRIESDEGLAAMLDVPRLRAALEDWPSETEIDPQKYSVREFAVPRGLLTARFIKYVEGRNDV